MRVFLAGATGAIGRRLVPLLLRAGHDVIGTTRSAEKARELERAGVAAALLDVFDAQATRAAMRAADMEDQALSATGLDAIILRYGFFYGPGTWHENPTRKPGLHIDAAAQAACLALTRGAAGIYNIADDDGVVAIAKARAEIGFDPQFRLR